MHPVVFEGILFLAIVIGAITQVIVPALRGRPLFPWLRFSRHGHQLDAAKAEVQAAIYDIDVERERRLAESLRASVQSKKEN